LIALAVTVRNILEMELLKKSELLSKEIFYDSFINKISILSSYDDFKRNTALYEEGELFLTDSDFIESNIENLPNLFSLFNMKKCYLLILKEVSNEIKDIFIENEDMIEFPVVNVKNDIQPLVVMQALFMLLLNDKKNTITEMQISNLVKDNKLVIDESLLNKINPNFLENVTALYCYSTDDEFDFSKSIVNKFNTVKQNICVPYKKGILIILSHNETSLLFVQEYVNSFIELLKSCVPNYVIGISNLNTPLLSIKDAIYQATICCTSMSQITNTVTYYDKFGAYSMLLLFKDSPEIRSIYDSTILPIIEYDKNHKKELLSTLIVFVDNSGDFKKAANILYQHENTVRYRIMKIKSLLGLEDSLVDFYERISLGVKLHKIYNMEE
jgi:hypothetical protein